MSDQVREWIDETIASTVDQFTQEEYAEEWDLEALVKQMALLYETEVTVDELREDLGEVSRESLIEEFRDDARDAYDAKEEELTSDLMRELERFVILQVVDTRWREHLENMDYLREGIHLRGMAQKDPLVEYRNEGHLMFQELNRAIREEVITLLFHAEIEPMEGAPIPEPVGVGAGGVTTPVAQKPKVNSEFENVGRNDLCPCGSGKKFKKCHGA